MLRLAFDFIITWRETRTRPNAYGQKYKKKGLPFYFNEVVSPFHCKTGEIRYICEIINYFN